MMNLITITGNSARKFYLDQPYLSDFKSLIRTVTSGRSMIISTKFRSDLFYKSKEPKNEEILKLWALYAKTDLTFLNPKHYKIYTGEEEVLSNYFSSINKLATHWFHFLLYKRAFRREANNDQKNPVTKVVVQCDQYLVQKTKFKRPVLTKSNEKFDSNMLEDTFSIVMQYINMGNNRN